MEFYTQTLQNLIAEFERLPGIGRKTAERLAYYILRASKDEAMKLAYAIRDVKKNVKNCRICFNISETDLCSVCLDPLRDESVICVVEQPKDLYAIERTGSYKGRYHVLMGAFAPLEGIAPEDLTINGLLERIRQQFQSGRPAQEIILATNPNFEGDGTALFLMEKLKADFPGLKITRIARGIPSGSNLEHVSKTIVTDALEGRRLLEG
ncbi:MAG: recombination protein RecR [Planctomycetes bacterium]|nr:recombination protein RecR [Planctomycetota bacterium]